MEEAETAQQNEAAVRLGEDGQQAQSQRGVAHINKGSALARDHARQIGQAKGFAALGHEPRDRGVVGLQVKFAAQIDPKK